MLKAPSDIRRISVANAKAVVVPDIWDNLVVCGIVGLPSHDFLLTTLLINPTKFQLYIELLATQVEVRCLLNLAFP